MSLEALTAQNVVEAENGVKNIYVGLSKKCCNIIKFVEAKILQPRNVVKQKSLGS